VKWYVGTAQDGVLRIGDIEYTEMPRGHAFRGITVYMVDTDWDSVVDLADHRDTVWGRGSQMGNIGGISVWCGKKNRMTLISINSWGGMPSEYDVSSGEGFMEEVESDLEKCGYPMLGNATRLSRKILRKHHPRGSGVFQLRPQFRSIAHEAIHPGAMLSMRGYLPYCVAIDRRQAYLQSLAVNVPIPGTFRNVRGMSERRILRTEGFVAATVWIDEQAVRNFPPLPVKRWGFKANPVGVIRGVWPTHVLRWALAMGHKLIQIDYAVACRVAPMLQGVQEECSQIPVKRVRKLAYTRLWGILTTMGGWRGGIIEGTTHNRINWYWGGGDYLSHTMRHDYRPDWAAFIVAENMMCLVDVCEALTPDSVAALHIDCVWTSDTEALEKANATDKRSSWAIKGTGDFRSYGTGMYRHGFDLACQGMPREKGATVQDVEEWVSQGEGAAGSAVSRDWMGTGYPHVDKDCVSRPVRHADPHGVTGDMMPEPSPDMPIWSDHGWCLKEYVDGLRDAAVKDPGTSVGEERVTVAETIEEGYGGLVGRALRGPKSRGLTPIIKDVREIEGRWLMQLGEGGDWTYVRTYLDWFLF